MASHELKVSTRTETGKSAAKRLRRIGLVPAVAYGHKEEPVKVVINAKELRDLLAHHAGHGLLTLKYEDTALPDVPVIIKALQMNHVKHTVHSVDFLRVSMDEEVTITVPIVLEGEPVGVTMDGGVLVQALHQLEVAALPANLPQQISVDVSELILNGPPIHVREITLPTGVKAITDGEESVAVVNVPKVEVEEPVATEEGAEGEAAEGDEGAEGEAADSDNADR
ncbi:MAG TPA: 50S ribosomal protein L25 [Abditibacteriaceae bacterium]|nr:50S ribosomal protein L25 [Abditibacteriaceae bacterium]